VLFAGVRAGGIAAIVLRNRYDALRPTFDARICGEAAHRQAIVRLTAIFAYDSSPQRVVARYRAVSS